MFVRSVWDADQLNPGFDAAHLGTVSFNLGDQAYSEDRGREYQQRALEVARQDAGRGFRRPRQGCTLHADLPQCAPGRARTPRPGVGWPTYVKVVGPGYFAALRIPIVAGRDFSLFDRKNGAASGGRRPGRGSAFLARPQWASRLAPRKQLASPARLISK